MAKSFGQYIRDRREEARLSLRHVATAMGVSFVHLGEVERGEAPPFKRERWQLLCQTIPGVSYDELAELCARQQPVQLHLEHAPKKYRDVGLALARRIEEQDLSQQDLSDLMRLLRGGAHE